jgi:hypothetical protein
MDWCLPCGRCSDRSNRRPYFPTVKHIRSDGWIWSLLAIKRIHGVRKTAGETCLIRQRVYQDDGWDDDKRNRGNSYNP